MERLAKAVNKPFVSGVAILKGSSILLAKRIEVCPINKTKIPYAGYWSVFTGSSEPNESPRQCAVREVFEETKIKIKTKDLAPVHVFQQEYRLFHLFCYRTHELITPSLNFEHTEYGWFDINSLSGFTEKIDHNLIEVIKNKCT